MAGWAIYDNQFLGTDIKLLQDKVSVSFNPSQKTTFKLCNLGVNCGLDSSTSLAFNSSFKCGLNSFKPLLYSFVEDVTFDMRNSTYANNYFTTSERGKITYLTLKNDVIYSKSFAFVAGLSKYISGNQSAGNFNATFIKPIVIKYNNSDGCNCTFAVKDDSDNFIAIDSQNITIALSKKSGTYNAKFLTDDNTKLICTNNGIEMSVSDIKISLNEESVALKNLNITENSINLGNGVSFSVNETALLNSSMNEVNLTMSQGAIK